MIPVVVCTIGSPSLPVLEASIKAYAPEAELVVHEGEETNFGDAYNAAMASAFERHEEIIIANDDIVLRPDTMRLLMEDVRRLQAHCKLGLVGSRSDVVRPIQSICNTNGASPIRTSVLSPLFAWVSKDAFAAAQFPPINWYSDDVLCLDLANAGYEHYISRSYVHHAGSMSIGHNVEKLVSDAAPWLLANRPQYAAAWGIK